MTPPEVLDGLAESVEAATGLWTPGPWALSAGVLIRVYQPGTQVTIAGIYRIGRARNCPEADALPKANGRLIAAAPDIAAANAQACAALRDAATFLRSVHFPGYADALDRHAGICRAALDKAGAPR